MQGMVIGFGLGILLISSVIGGLILLALAKGVGKINNAKFGNSFLICLISGLITLVIWYSIGFETLAAMGVGGIIVLNIVMLAVVYITVGKFIWKCEWIESIKANIIWIVLYAIVMGFMFSSMPTY